MPRPVVARTVKLVLEYDGTNFSGFQVQPDARTIQGEIEEALERLTGTPTRAHGAGRTDAGVHALGQVVSFETDCPVPDERFAPALNRMLTDEIVVLRSGPAPEGFHARYSARGKIYEYRLMRGEHRAPVRGRFAQHVHPWPDIAAMGGACRCLVGRHDFSAFAATGGKATDMVREIRRAKWIEEAEGATFSVEADGFLYKMVRNIVGTALEIGSGRRPVESMAAVLSGRDRAAAGPTAPARGLSLVRVLYG